MSLVSYTKCKKCQKVAYVLKFQPHTGPGYVCLDFQACFERQTKIRAARRQ